jgi:hypothetical protein
MNYCDNAYTKWGDKHDKRNYGQLQLLHHDDDHSVSYKKMNITTIHSFLWQGFLIKIPKMTGVKKPPCQSGQVNLDLLVSLSNH